MSRMALFVLIAGVAISLSACAGVGPTGTLPPASSTASDALQPTTEYIIGPGDKLDISVWQNMDLTRQMPVRPDGRIAMPLIGEIVAVGKTPQSLAAEIQEKLRSYVASPLVTIIPTEFVGPLSRQVRVIGEAAQPKNVAFRSSMTTLDVMIEVGGLTRYADGDRAVIVRNVDGRQQTYRVHLDALIRDGDVSQNVDVQPGDILIIPQRFF